MPRTGKGSKVHPQRTDLNTALPVETAGAEGREFGAVSQDVAAQEAVPMRPPPTPGITPGGLGALSRPTERPNEPITSGVPVGPGPGPEALRLGPAAMLEGRTRQMNASLTKLAMLTGDPYLNSLLGDD